MVTQQHGEFVYVGDAQIRENNFVLSEPEAHHLLRVRRIRAGEEVFATDGKGCVYRTRLSASYELEIIDIIPNFGETAFELTLICGCLQGDAAREVVSIAVQLGVNSLTWVRMLRSQETYSDNKLEKLDRVAIHATKQTGRAHLMNQHVGENLQYALTQHCTSSLWAAHPDSYSNAGSEQITPEQSHCLIVGPEGGFDPSELNLLSDRKVQFIRLGSRRLRTEIAVAAGLTHLLTKFDAL